MKNCQTCGFANSADSNFCAQCGARLDASTCDTTSAIPIVDDDVQRAEFDIEAATETLTPGTALLLVTRGMGSGTSFSLDQPATVAGRSPDCDILLDDITVSRQHATFGLADATVTVTDNGSLNGTYVNRELISGPTALKRGDEVQIGKYRMIVLVNERGYV